MYNCGRWALVNIDVSFSLIPCARLETKPPFSVSRKAKISESSLAFSKFCYISFRKIFVFAKVFLKILVLRKFFAEMFVFEKVFAKSFRSWDGFREMFGFSRKF
jgi:hypothetical protein